MSILHVRHIQEALTREFDGLIDLSDVPAKAPASDRQAQFLSRALAAFTVRHVTGCSSQDAALAVIDGRDDNGIDAIGVDEAEPHLWLIQAKWSNQGTAGFDLNASLKLVDGAKLLLNSRYSTFNSRFQAMADKVDDALADPNVKITLVPAVLGHEVLDDVVLRPMDDLAEALNDDKDKMLDIRVFGLRHFHRSIRADSAPPSIVLPAVLEGCGWLFDPYLAYYGYMPVDQVARWYEIHGDRLFDQNIRRSLGLTKVNRELVDTLCNRPSEFWYFNNGITVLCGKIQKGARFATTPSGPRELKLENPSVVNGAQTVAAITEALRRDPEGAKHARVWVRLISLENCPDGFAAEVTGATNTQNRVEKRDLAALDAIQVRLRDEFAWALGKTYVIKRGDNEPDPAYGCSNVEAAFALACAHRSPELAVQARTESDSLWEMSPGGSYSMLFAKRLTVHRVWRTVLLCREVDRYLADTKDSREGRASAIAINGRLLLAHIVFHSLSHEEIDLPDARWEHGVLPQVRPLAESALGWLINAVDAEFGDSSYVVSIFKNSEKCQILTRHVLAGVRSGQTPAIPAAYLPSPPPRRRTRLANAVSVIVEAGALAEGTPLEFRPRTKEELRIMPGWIAEDPRRGRATWVNSRSKPILWEADGQQYAPSALANHMRQQALKRKSKAVQGPRYWFIPGAGSLADFADSIRRDE